MLIPANRENTINPKHRQRHKKIPRWEVNNGSSTFRCVCITEQIPATMHPCLRLWKYWLPNYNLYGVAKVIADGKKTSAKIFKTTVQAPTNGLSVINKEQNGKQNRDKQ